MELCEVLSEINELPQVRLNQHQTGLKTKNFEFVVEFCHYKQLASADMEYFKQKADMLEDSSNSVVRACLLTRKLPPSHNFSHQILLALVKGTCSINFYKVWGLIRDTFFKMVKVEEAEIP